MLPKILNIQLQFQAVLVPEFLTPSTTQLNSLTTQLNSLTTQLNSLSNLYLYQPKVYTSFFQLFYN